MTEWAHSLQLRDYALDYSTHNIVISSLASNLNVASRYKIWKQKNWFTGVLGFRDIIARSNSNSSQWTEGEGKMCSLRMRSRFLLGMFVWYSHRLGLSNIGTSVAHPENFRGGGQRGHAPPKFLENVVSLCFERRFSKQKCYSPKMKHFGIHCQILFTHFLFLESEWGAMAQCPPPPSSVCAQFLFWS